MDLAELETRGERTMEVGEEADTKTVLLRQWLETLTQVTRYMVMIRSFIIQKITFVLNKSIWLTKFKIKIFQWPEFCRIMSGLNWNTFVSLKISLKD